jgi:hypothetical protein
VSGKKQSAISLQLRAKTKSKSRAKTKGQKPRSTSTAEGGCGPQFSQPSNQTQAACGDPQFLPVFAGENDGGPQVIEKTIYLKTHAVNAPPSRVAFLLERIP